MRGIGTSRRTDRLTPQGKECPPAIAAWPVRAHSPRMRTRHGVSTEAAASDVATLAAGVHAMKDRSRVDAMDPLGWTYQSRMHGNPQATERAPGEPEDWSQCN